MASSSNAFIKWVAGILATVISGVLIYYFTAPPKPPVPSQTSIQIEGRVIDLEKKSLVEGARVTLRAGVYSGSQLTDTLGRYGFDVPLPETTEATFLVDASGYQQYSVNATLKRLSEVGDDQLLHEAVGGGNTSAVDVPPPPPSSSQPQGGAGTGAVAAGGKGAAIGALIGAVANHGPAGVKQPVPSAPPSQNPGQTKTSLVLPPYVRRPDLVKIGSSH